MSDFEEEEEEESSNEIAMTDDQKIDIAKWFLLNSPPGEIQYVVKGPSFLLLFFSFSHWIFC